jgi:DNA helicase-2/ATP-dependent DNA helicase PcrA
MEEVRFLLNAQQLRAVEHADGSLLVVAGAGTGKTGVITRRISRLIERGVAPNRILALTFTEKAAQEMEERVDLLVPYGYSNVWISTFHSFGDRVLRDNALSIGLVPDFKVLSEAECVIFLKEHLFELPLNHFRPAGDPTRYLSALVKFIARLKDEDVSPEDFLSLCDGLENREDVTEDYVQEQTELARTYAAYEELKLRYGYFDFGDQCTLTLKLFRTKPAILRRYQERFLHILADEFQDTNHAQFELLKLLAGQRGNITVVADDDQSIYKFRGAAISNVLGFVDVYPNSNDITLTKNYRSVQSILDSAYRLITHNNPDRLEVKNGIAKRLTSMRSAGDKAGVKHFHFDTITNEADFVARTIAERVEGGEARYKDFAILVRANSDAVPFLRALGERAIPHHFSGSSGLYSTEEIRLLISFLKVITDHTDNLSLFHLASSPVYGLNAKDLVPCNNISRRRHIPLLKVMGGVASGTEESVELSSEGLQRIKRLIKDVDRFSEMALTEPTGRVLYAFLTDTGYIASLSSVESEESVEKVRNIARFFDLTTHMENTLAIRKAHTLTRHLTLLMETGDDPRTVEVDPEADCVRVLTVHKAKGLEFPVVFMVGLVSERFPRRERKDAIEVDDELIKGVLPSGDFHLQEERRLFYVGMTRAMNELYLTSAADYGGVRAKKVSQFVLEALDKPRADTIIKSSPAEAIERFAPALKSHTTEGPMPDGAVLHLSHYQIDDYLTCPLKYRYVHILRVPLLPHHTIMYGKAMHEAIKVYFRRNMEGVPITQGELIDVFRASWRNEGFVSREHEQARWKAGQAALESFFEREGKDGITPAAVERDFYVELGNNVLSGRWDLIEERDDGPYIIDFKTSDVREKKKADRRAKESIQLRLYALAYRESFERLPAGVELRFVESGLVGSATFGNKDMEKTVTLIEKVADGIRKRDFAARPGYNVCNWCAFNNICPQKATKGCFI